MSKGLNKCEFIGNVGRDPEVKSTPSGVLVANFSIGVSERYKDRNGQLQEHTEWVRLVAWERTAEIVRDYVSKGDQVYIEGKMQTREWDDKGVTRSLTEYVVRELLMLSPKPQTGDNAKAKRGR